MKILIDIRLLGRGGLTGIEEYARELVNAILKADSVNRYQLFYNGVRKNPLPKEWREAPQTEIINWRIPNRLLDLTVRALNTPKIDDFIKTDVIFSPHFNILAARSAPRLVTFHDLSFIHHPYFFNTRQRFWHWLQDYQTQAREASKIIADSEFTKSDLMTLLRVPEEKIAVIYPGVNANFKKLSARDQDLENFKKCYRLTYPFLLYLGTLEPRKNIPAVIRAFSWLKTNRAFRDLRLIIAGRPGWLYRDILKEAELSPAREHITFWGPVKDEERVFLYNLAEAFVYPSFFEGFGFPPLEAQACGAPVVVADRTSLSEVIGSSGLAVNPWKIDALTEALASLLTSAKLKNDCVRRGYENVKKFIWQKTAAQVLELLHHA